MSMSPAPGVLQKAVAEEGFSITADEIEKLPPALQARLQKWLEGDRAFPRFLTPYYRDETIAVTAFTDGEEWTSESLAEEIADTFTMVGVVVASPEQAVEVIAAYTDDETHEAAAWTLAVHIESAAAPAEGRDAHALACPECILRLLKADADAAQPASPAPPASPALPSPVTGETREEAITRLQAGLHDVRQRYIERRSHYEVTAEAAKNAKKAMEAAQETLNDLIGELDDAINSETWQTRLPLKFDAESSAQPERNQSATNDPAKNASVQQLVEFGVSQIKGIGESAADKVSDALIAWRGKWGYGT